MFPPTIDNQAQIVATEIGKISHPIDRLLAFVDEREAIRRRRAKGNPWPWTNDQILRRWSFCNVRREDDRVTRWIANNWRKPRADDRDLWFAMTVARLVNRIETLAALGFPVPWRPEHFLEVMSSRGREAYGGAYMIHADSKKRSGIEPRPTPIYQVEALFDPLWAERAEIRPRRNDTLAAFDGIFRQLQDEKIIEGLGPFYIGQIVADLKYVEPLASAKDWWTYCVPGPGSRRGLNRILGRAVEASWDEGEWRRELWALHADIAGDLEDIGIGRLCAQDINNCLCEWDKYERTRLGEGRPKRKFVRSKNGIGGQTPIGHAISHLYDD
jgi:hypothetical protein